MFSLFIEGGPLGMAILTIVLLALLLAAWKAPAWVKEIGMIALVWGVLYFLLGFFQAAGVLAIAGDIHQSVIWAGMKVAIISPMYGLIIYLLSLIIRIIQKPRI